MKFNLHVYAGAELICDKEFWFPNPQRNQWGGLTEASLGAMAAGATEFLDNEGLIPNGWGGSVQCCGSIGRHQEVPSFACRIN